MSRASNTPAYSGHRAVRLQQHNACVHRVATHRNTALQVCDAVLLLVQIIEQRDHFGTQFCNLCIGFIQLKLVLGIGFPRLQRHDLRLQIPTMHAELRLGGLRALQLRSGVVEVHAKCTNLIAQLVVVPLKLADFVIPRVVRQPGTVTEHAAGEVALNERWAATRRTRSLHLQHHEVLGPEWSLLARIPR